MNTNDGHADESTAPVGTPFTVRTTKVDQERNPDLEAAKSVALKAGPRVRKEAVYLDIRDRHTGATHHHSLTIKTLKKKDAEFVPVVENSITLSDEDKASDEIQKLIDFAHACHTHSVPNESGRYVVVNAPGVADVDGAALQKILRSLSTPGKAELLVNVLAQASKNPELLAVLLERAGRDPHLFAEAAAALNLATYRAAVDELKTLIATSEREDDFQKLLARHPWMFGSEYSEMLDRRKWTRDEQTDFVVRRTTDGYIELIEIKTPLKGARLFNPDPSHKTFYPGAELSKVLGQVLNYIEKLDADRNAIKANDCEDTCKIRAKIIIGRNGDEHQQRALRRLNGHLHRVEVITFDQLHNIAENVLKYLDTSLQPARFPPPAGDKPRIPSWARGEQH